MQRLNSTPIAQPSTSVTRNRAILVEETQSSRDNRQLQRMQTVHFPIITPSSVMF